MIEYLYLEGEEACSKEPLKVRIDGRVSGEIRKVDGGYRYFTRDGRHSGKLFKTVVAVQKSLRAD